MDSMFEQFSSGYYLGRLYVEPRDDDRPAMSRVQHEQVNQQLYTDDEGVVARTDLPLVMKLENHHFAVQGDDTVPDDTLAVPRELIEDTHIRNPPTLHEVFLAKADRAKQLLSVADGTPTADERDDSGGVGRSGPSGPSGPTGPGGPTGI
jgi:hypothetical protein